MAGFGLADWPYDRIPCPHCGSTDCCGIREYGGKDDTFCIVKNRRVTENQLRKSIIKHFRYFVALPTSFFTLRTRRGDFARND